MKWKNNEIESYLLWLGILRKEHEQNKAGKLNQLKLERRKRKQPLMYVKWTNEDEEKLTKLRCMDINISETALGRLKQEQLKRAAECLCKLKREEMNALLNEYGEKDMKT